MHTIAFIAFYHANLHWQQKPATKREDIQETRAQKLYKQ